MTASAEARSSVRRPSGAGLAKVGFELEHHFYKY